MPYFYFTLLRRSRYTNPRDLSKVEWSFTDFGTMWTFDSVPADRFEKEYGFHPSREWLDDVRLSALQFANGCSASFVSEDGLIITKSSLRTRMAAGAYSQRRGLSPRRILCPVIGGGNKSPGAFADQLISITDVTGEVLGAMLSGKDNVEKIIERDSKIKEIKSRYSKETGLVCEVVEFITEGNIHSMPTEIQGSETGYGPDFQIASTGMGLG